MTDLKETLNDAPVWDLTAFYSGIEDPKIQEDFAKAKELAKGFEEKYRGKINAQTSDSEILEGIKSLESLMELMEKPVIFAMLVNSIYSTDPATGAFLQKAKTEVTDIYNGLIFFDLDLVNLPDARQAKLIASPILANYKHFFQKQFQYKPHRLSEAEERILNDKSLTSRGAFVRLFDQRMAGKKYLFNGKEVNQSEVLDSLHDSDRSVRAAGAEAFTAGLKDDAELLTFIFNMCATDKEISDRYHKFSIPQQSRNMDNELTQEIVDSMVSAVTGNYKIVADYYAFKKEVSGLNKLYDYDRYAPLAETNEKFTFAQAKELILKSFQNFSPEFADNAQKFFDNNWIHAKVMPGKAGGGYCHPTTPSMHPLILMNFQGNTDDVKTLAHELGHGVNNLFMDHLTLFNYDLPLTLAETASVFAEMLVFKDLKDKIADPNQKLGFIMNKIEGVIATVFRQTSLHQFETEFYAQKAIKGELTPAEINSIWIKTQNEMFKGSVEITDNYSWWWSYISHFLHVPFYVYAYSFGELLVLSLYAKYQKEGQPFIPKYLTVMSAGSTKSPQELLNEFNINLSDPNFWTEGLNIISELITEAKQLHQTIKK